MPHLNPGEFSLKQQVGFNIVPNVGKIRHTTITHDPKSVCLKIYFVIFDATKCN